MDEHMANASRHLPAWEVADLAEPRPLGLKNLAGLIGPGIVMCGIQIGGGEWLFGPAITAKFGGSLMWIATVSIVLQIFYNIECGRYAMYCGEPVFTGFMRTSPGPLFWVGVTVLLSIGLLIPGLSTNAAVLITTLIRGRPPIAADTWLVNSIAIGLIIVVVLPVLLGGKVYNVLQLLMSAKVFIVLGFCLFIGVCFVSPRGWYEVFSGFLKFGNVPVTDAAGNETTVNAFAYWWKNGSWPVIAASQLVMLGAFAGYAGGGGLSNSTYSNFVRDKGWGMGSRVGAIASAVGGHDISLSHVGKVFPLTEENLRRWRGWWKYILSDQLLVWGPGCFMGMALPALLSIEFAKQSPMYGKDIVYSQPLIAADGLLHAASVGSWAGILWTVAVIVGLFVFLPSQMAIVDDFARRWTDIIWSANSRVREGMGDRQVSVIYYTILGLYVVWTLIAAAIFLRFGDAPKLMTSVIANLNNLALGFTSFHILWINTKFLPPPLRPPWYCRLGIVACGVYSLGLAGIVFAFNVVPTVLAWFK